MTESNSNQHDVRDDEMNALRYSQRDIESAVEIANIAGHYGFKTENSRDMMSNFIDWAVAFEKKPYDTDNWMELIEAFAVEMLVIEVERGKATFNGESHQYLQSIQKPSSLDAWKATDAMQWVHLPEHGDRILTKAHFVDLCEGNIERAYQLVHACECQAPETVLDEAGGLATFFAEETKPARFLSVGDIVMWEADQASQKWWIVGSVSKVRGMCRLDSFTPVANLSKFGIAVDEVTPVYGKIAQEEGKKLLPLRVFKSSQGFYMGTPADDSQSFSSRESLEHFKTAQEAKIAVCSGNWTQRMAR